MRKLVLLGLVVICALSVVHGFFIPWAKASVSATKVAKGLVSKAEESAAFSPFASGFIKKLSKTTDKISDLGDIQAKTAVSGYDIPALINKNASRIAIEVATIFFKNAKDLDRKSLLVYLLPLLALACIALAVVGMKNNVFIIVMAVLSGAISIAGLYNLMTVDLTKLPIQISIEQGLWQTMYAYLSIFIIGIIWIVLDLKKVK